MSWVVVCTRREQQVLPGGPVAKTILSGGQVPSLIRELDPTCYNEKILCVQ